MANTQTYLNHLLQNIGITPACSEEERLAAEDIAQIFSNHGFEPEIQEFAAPAASGWARLRVRAAAITAEIKRLFFILPCLLLSRTCKNSAGPSVRPQGLHRLQAGGLDRGVHPENDPQHHREQEGPDGDGLGGP